MGRGKADLDLMKEFNVITRDDLPKHCGDVRIDMERDMGVKAFESTGSNNFEKKPPGSAFEGGQMEVKASKLWIVPVGLGTGFIGSDVANCLQDRRREKYEKELRNRGE